MLGREDAGNIRSYRVNRSRTAKIATPAATSPPRRIVRRCSRSRRSTLVARDSPDSPKVYSTASAFSLSKPASVKRSKALCVSRTAIGHSLRALRRNGPLCLLLRHNLLDFLDEQIEKLIFAAATHRLTLTE